MYHSHWGMVRKKITSLSYLLNWNRFIETNQVCLDSSSRGSQRSSFSRRDPEINLLIGALNYAYLNSDTTLRYIWSQFHHYIIWVYFKTKRISTGLVDFPLINILAPPLCMWSFSEVTHNHLTHYLLHLLSVCCFHLIFGNTLDLI